MELNIKKRILFGVFLVIYTTGYVQNPISISATNLELHLDNADLTIMHVIKEEFSITNISDEKIELVWHLEKSETCNDDWVTIVTDSMLEYLSITTNDGILTSDLEAGESWEQYSLALVIGGDDGLEGCCTMKLHFFLDGDINDTLGTVGYDIRINDPDCALTDTEEEIASAIRVFPNPMTNYFQIDGNESNTVKELVVYNLIGRQVRTFDAINQSQFDMSGLPQDIYLVGMVGSNGEILKTVRLSRQFITP